MIYLRHPRKLSVFIIILTLHSLAYGNTFRCEDLFKNDDSLANLPSKQDLSELFQKLKEQDDIKNWDGVLWFANRILAVDSNNFVAINRKIKALIGLSRYEDFFGSIKDSLQNTSDPIVRLPLSDKELEELAQFSANVLKVQPENIVFLRLRAFAQYKMKEYAEFITTTNKVLAHYPEDHSLFEPRLKALKKLRRFSDYRLEIDKTLQQVPRHAPALFAKVEDLMGHRRIHEAEKWLNQAPDSLKKELLKARLLMMLGQYSLALDLLMNQQKTSEIQWLIAQASFLKGDMKRAKITLIHLIQGQNQLHISAVAALLKIQKLGEGDKELDIWLKDLLAVIPRHHVNHIYKLVRVDFLSFVPEPTDQPVSITNPFWSGLNTRPINKQTLNSTK